EPRSRGAAATEHEFRLLLEADLDVALDLADGLGVDHRSHVGAGLAAVAELERLGAVDEHLEERVVDAVLQDEAAGGRAALPRGAEGAPEHAVEREVELGVVEDDLRVLAAHFEREPLVQAAAGLADLAARLGAARERDQRDTRVLD